MLNNNGVLSQNVQESVDAFAEKFSFLSKPTEDEVFDAEFKSQVDDVIRSINAGDIVWNSSMFDVLFSIDELMTVRNSKCKCRKAGGPVDCRTHQACWFRVDENIDFCV